MLKAMGWEKKAEGDICEIVSGMVSVILVIIKSSQVSVAVVLYS